jgi:hypothetical protein
LNDATGLDIVVCGVGSDNVEKWCHVLDINGKDEVRGLTEVPSGNLLIAGVHAFGLFMFSLSSDGEVLWVRDDILPPNKTNETDQVWGMDVTPEGNIVIVGQEMTVRYILPFLPPAYIVRNFMALLDPNGDTIWNTAVGGAELHGVTVTRQGTFMATGSAGDDLVVVEVSADGRVLN